MTTVTVDGLTLEGYNESVHGWPGDRFTARARKDVVLDDGTRVAFHLSKWSLLAPGESLTVAAPRATWGMVLLTNPVWGDWRLVRAHYTGAEWRLGDVVDEGGPDEVVSPQPRPGWLYVA